MEINAAAYLGSSHVPANIPSVSGNSGFTDQSAFAELLRRTENAKELKAGGNIQTGISKSEIDKNDKLYGLCMELETFLIKNLIKGMRSTVQKTNLVDTGFAGEMYEDMLYDEYAKSFARNASFGFAEMAYRELSGAKQ